MRPVYESDADRLAEARVSALFSEAWNGTIIRMPPLARVDRLMLVNGAPRAWLEIKCRNHDFGKYDTYMLSADKFYGMLNLAKETKVPALLVVGYFDGIVWVNTGEVGGLRIFKGGRTDRNDPKDIEKVVKIPLVKFQRLRK